MTKEESRRTLLTERIKNDYAYHAPTHRARLLHESTRDLVRSVAAHYASRLPESREQLLALDALDASLMWANASIARNHHKLDPEGM